MKELLKAGGEKIKKKEKRKIAKAESFQYLGSSSVQRAKKQGLPSSMKWKGLVYRNTDMPESKVNMYKIAVFMFRWRLFVFHLPKAVIKIRKPKSVWKGLKTLE